VGRVDACVLKELSKLPQALGTKIKIMLARHQSGITFSKQEAADIIHFNLSASSSKIGLQRLHILVLAIFAVFAIKADPTRCTSSGATRVPGILIFVAVLFLTRRGFGARLFRRRDRVQYSRFELRREVVASSQQNCIT